jgi:hypothetical protein
MPRSTNLVRSALAGVATGVLLAGAPPTQASAAHASIAPRRAPVSRHVSVPMGARGFALPRRVHAGWVTFRAHTLDPAGHQLEGFRTLGGATPTQVVDDIKRAVSFDPGTSVAGTADTRRDAVLVGGPSVDPRTPVSVTIALRAGTYHFFDFDDFFTPGQHVTLHTLQVVGRFSGHAPRAHGRVVETMVNGHPRFLGPARLPARRTIKVVNTGDELHELLIARVKPGTTDRQVQSYYASGSTDPASYALEPALRGVAAMDPGRVAYVRFHHLRAGRYSLLCFVPDDMTGLPHVAEGMHHVVRLHR